MLVAGVAFPWVFGFLTTFPPFYLTSGVDGNGNCQQTEFWPSPSLQIFYALFLLVGTDYLILLVFFSYTYARILKAMNFKSTVVTSHEDRCVAIGQTTQQPSQSSRSQRKIIRAMIIVVGCFAVLNSPLQTYIVMKDVAGMDIDAGGDFLSLAVIFSNLDLCIDPIIYAFQLDAVSGVVRKVTARCQGAAAVAPTDDSSRY